MKKAAGVVLALLSLTVLYYFGFQAPVVTRSIPEFFAVLGDYGIGQADFVLFIESLGNVFFSLSIIFLCFAVLWIAIDMVLSKDEQFKFVVTRTTMVFLAAGGGLFFGTAFAYALSRLLQVNVPELLIEVVFAIAALEFTLDLLRYLGTDARKFHFSMRVTER